MSGVVSMATRNTGPDGSAVEPTGEVGRLHSFAMTGVFGVGVVVVTYETPPHLVDRCLASIVGSIVDNGMAIGDVVVVDNASTVSPNVPDGVRLLRRDRNDGFAAGVNHGIAALDSKCSFVFLLNPDATVSPTAIARCLSRLTDATPNTVAVAPKMILVDVDGTPVGKRLTLDAVGIGVNAKAEAANRGLGQPDLGQYDRSDDVFGACFGAALIRRSAFAPHSVGAVDERLFLYYEDVAWCWAAQLIGHRIVTEPSALVHHVMSAGVVRERPYAFKFEHTERNLLLCALMFLEPRHALTVTGRRTLGLLRGSMLGRHYPLAGLRALLGVVRRLPHVVAVRRRITARRVRTDAQIAAYRHDEPIFFDSVNYRVPDARAAEAFAEQRLATMDRT